MYNFKSTLMYFAVVSSESAAFSLSLHHIKTMELGKVLPFPFLFGILFTICLINFVYV